MARREPERRYTILLTLLAQCSVDLVGVVFSPRIRDLGKITLCRTGSKAEAAPAYRHAGQLFTRRANMALVIDTSLYGHFLRMDDGAASTG